jgi:hypothetical protein
MSYGAPTWTDEEADRALVYDPLRNAMLTETMMSQIREEWNNFPVNRTAISASMWNRINESIDKLDNPELTRFVKTKCKHCGQWGERETECTACGAPID